MTKRIKTIADLASDELFDLVMIWISQGPLLICGELQPTEQRHGLLVIETFNEGEIVKIPLGSDKLISIHESITKARFRQLTKHFQNRCLEISY